MTLLKAPVIIVTVLYVAQCALFIWHKQYANAVIFAGYAVANLGVIASL